MPLGGFEVVEQVFSYIFSHIQFFQTHLFMHLAVSRTFVHTGSILHTLCFHADPWCGKRIAYMENVLSEKIVFHMINEPSLNSHRNTEDLLDCPDVQTAIAENPRS